MSALHTYVCLATVRTSLPVREPFSYRLSLAPLCESAEEAAEWAVRGLELGASERLFDLRVCLYDDMQEVPA